MSEAPQNIGPYRILAVLGQGGMGIVYRAEHRFTGMVAAVKTVHTPNEDVLRCLRREIRALARIRHPGVVRILEEGIEGGLPWYAMELVDGLTLRQDSRHWAIDPTWVPHDAPTGLDEDADPRVDPNSTRTVQRRPLRVSETMLGPSPAFRPSDPTVSAPTAARVAEIRPVADLERLMATLGLVRRLCWSLAFVHGEGIVHRDLKPENVLVRRDGTPILMDFGLAVYLKQDRSRDHLGLNAGVSGTVFYMAPEQLRGEFVDARADLYALGCILYELVTGNPPFVGPHPSQVAHQHFRMPPVPPSTRIEGLPPALDDVILRLLEKDPSRRFGHAEDVAAALARLGANGFDAPTSARPRSYLYRPGLAGRAVVLQQLAEHLTRVEVEHGGVVLIGGESGVGKTRLVLEVSREASNRKMRLLTAECLPTAADDTEASGGIALHPLQQALRAVADRCREHGVEETERLLGRGGKVLAPLEPSLAGLPGQDAYPEPAELPAPAARQRLYSYLAATLAALAEERPTLFVIDDLQWADDLTLGFLEFLLRGGQTTRMKLLVLGTFRTEALGSRASLRSLLAAPQVDRFELERLLPDAVGSMVSDMLAVLPPPKSLVEFLTRQSEGNPFFVAEYLKTAVAQEMIYRDELGRWQLAGDSDAATGETPQETFEDLTLPATLRRLVSRRLRDLPASTRTLVEAAAVVGREAPSILVWRIARLEVTELLDATTEALRRQILDEVGTGSALRFVHDKIREVAYHELRPEQHSALHRAAAQGIEALSMLSSDRQIAELAHHWEQAGEKQRAQVLYLEAARKVRTLYLHDEAERLYRAYLRLAESPTAASIQVRNELAREVLSFRGDNATAIREHEIALSEARQIGDRLGEAQSLQGLSTTNRMSGRVQDARNFGEQALAIDRQLGDRASEGVVLMVLAAAHLALGELQRAQTLFEEALRIDREIGASKHAAVTLSNLAVIAREQGQSGKAERLQLEALELHRQVGNRRSEGITLENLGTLELDCGRLPEASRLFHESLAIHREVGDRLYEAIPLNGLAILHLHQGDAREALDLWTQAIATCREVDGKLTEAQILQDGATLHRLGFAELETAATLLDQAEILARETGNPLQLVACLCERGHLQLANSRFASETLREAMRLVAQTETGPESRCAQSIGRLSRAVSAFEAGKRVSRGTMSDDLPAGLRARLEQEGALPAR